MDIVVWCEFLYRTLPARGAPILAVPVSFGQPAESIAGFFFEWNTVPSLSASSDRTWRWARRRPARRQQGNCSVVL